MMAFATGAPMSATPSSLSTRRRGDRRGRRGGRDATRAHPRPDAAHHRVVVVDRPPDRLRVVDRAQERVVVTGARLVADAADGMDDGLLVAEVVAQPRDALGGVH